MRLGTRASALALAQAKLVSELLGGCKIVPIVTSGDRAARDGGAAGPYPGEVAPAEAAAGQSSEAGAAGPHPGEVAPAKAAAGQSSEAGAAGPHAGEDAGGVAGVEAEGPRAEAEDPGNGANVDKSRWVRELERALIEGEIDLAVHSAKDVPLQLPAGLELVGAPARGAVEDVLCMGRPFNGAVAGHDESEDGALWALVSGARVGTSSIRRTAQLRAAREDLVVVALRGNVDTRLARLERGELDAIVLARAGLQRLGRGPAFAQVLDPAVFVPAPGQGTLALQVRADDARARQAVMAISDEEALASLLAERALARALGAGCDTPLGANAQRTGTQLRLRAWVGLADGSAWIADEYSAEASEPEALGRVVARRLEQAGAEQILRGEMPGSTRDGPAGEARA